jgi:nucleoside-diphosphate-sugar epimerase
LTRVLVTGGAGYVGHVLTPRLLDAGYRVTVYDALFFGCRLPNHPRLRVVRGDIRDTRAFAAACAEQDAVLHLACISNDASFELDERLSTSINYECFDPMVEAARRAGVRRFVYCSSSSVYGVSESPDVTEDHPLVPITLYNKFKGLCEPILLSRTSEDFTTVVLRPATVCGYSPRMRLDLSVNILTNHAVNRREILVFGGTQMRPNLHIDDMVDAYLLMLAAPHDAIQGQIFNIGFQNHTMTDLAGLVRSAVEDEAPDGSPIRIVTTPSDDRRSYHVNADKVRRVLGFTPRRTIADAVTDLTRAFRNSLLPNSFEEDGYYNVRTMKALGVR